jgi:hypothetical protein
MDTRESHRSCVAIAFGLALAATCAHGQGLGAAAAKEKAKRERSEGKPAVKVYDDASLKAQPGSSASEPASPAPSGEPATRAAGQAEEGEARQDTTPALPICGGFEMLRAWSEAHEKYARECGGGPREGTSGRFNIELVIGSSGRVEEVSVTPETPYTTCVAGKMRGHSMPAPAEGKRCRAPYQAMWNL